jgi:hypothetical protein
MRGGRGGRWASLALGLAVMALAVAALGRAGSSAGGLLAHSRMRELESDAYFYTEVGDVREFLGGGDRRRLEAKRIPLKH